MQPSSNAENNPKHNRPQKNNIYSQVKHYRSSLISYIVEKYDNSSFKKTTMPFNLNRSISTSVSMIVLIYIKTPLRAGDYAAAVCATKSTQLKQDRTTRCVTSTQEQFPSLFGKRFNLCRSQNDVQNKKTFSQQTIPVQIKRSTV